jgi:hypothetical protein
MTGIGTLAVSCGIAPPAIAPANPPIQTMKSRDIRAFRSSAL